MKNLIKTILFTFAILKISFGNAQEKEITKTSFDNVNLTYPGLEKVNKLFEAGKYTDAANELLTYYRTRKNSKLSDFNLGDEAKFKGKEIGKADQEKADNALLHQFKPQKGYGFFDYGKDINWDYWPVKDNEIRWQLHRVTWWQSMGIAYRASGEEKYAKEWIFQFRDWEKKNYLGRSIENNHIAWRPLEVSERIQSLPGTFNLFVVSPNFTPAFLMEFLNSFDKQTSYIPENYSKEGNHLLFEAQRVLGAGAFFPELKKAEEWRKSGIEVLNREIKLQVLPDGVQWELSPTYHIACIDIFLKAYNSAKMAGVEKEFPNTYSETIEKMITAVANISFPDYNNPMFGDSWPVEKRLRMKQFADWSKIFPENELMKYFATNGAKGKVPDYLSSELPNAGFYTFRNGWNDQSTVLILKAGPPAEFHAQPDNGTFELWVKGRNFTPDSGSYLYSGDAEITKKRNWYRQTKVHSTLTLNNENMIITKAQQNKWKTSKNLDILTYTNPSYTDLNHQRTVFFIDKKYFVIIDRAIGKATGNLGIHFQLKEDSKPVFDTAKNKIYTTYADGNNLLIQAIHSDHVTLTEEDGKVSYIYAKEVKRPAFVFEKIKNENKNELFATIIFPYGGSKAPEIKVKPNRNNDFEKGNIDLNITVNGKKSKITAQLID
ncbi:heparinase II/III family protein [Flavobacterium sp. Fl-318]|uniref:Heparinase II/III family protein n=1 Tax=Flavobacterium cupriresistens TaxID=2893885 RepID=A0ABU4RHA2_9FLAO|nr:MULTISPECIES: heparin-sulfate lyase HepC [unclassified Flavobacterium]MDX6191930.1 heparinase II/III family protein [Flavobacterium sp. Fl-318]UFH44569.1 heparinase II/III family protein [Flavobacterium sp. F-323]